MTYGFMFLFVLLIFYNNILLFGKIYIPNVYEYLYDQSVQCLYILGADAKSQIKPHQIQHSKYE